MPSPVTLITGTRKGIGRPLAEHYLAQGHGRRPEPGEPPIAAPDYLHYCADVCDEREVQKAVRADPPRLRPARPPDQQRRHRRHEPRAAHARGDGAHDPRRERRRHVPALPRGREAHAAAKRGRIVNFATSPCRSSSRARRSTPRRRRRWWRSRESRARARGLWHHGQRRRPDAGRDRPHPRRAQADKIDALIARQAIRRLGDVRRRRQRRRLLPRSAQSAS